MNHIDSDSGSISGDEEDGEESEDPASPCSPASPMAPKAPMPLPLLRLWMLGSPSKSFVSMAKYSVLVAQPEEPTAFAFLTLLELSTSKVTTTDPLTMLSQFVELS